MEVLLTTQRRIAAAGLVIACLAIAFVLPVSADAAAAWPENTVFEEYKDPVQRGKATVDESEASPTSVRDQFIDALNELRAEHDVAPLRPLTSMHHAARDWTEEMVEATRLAHADVIYAGLGDNWKFAGENVGRGETVESLMEAFMASETHRANILDARFTHVGVAAMPHDDGRIYTTHRFAQFEGMRRGARLPVVR